VDAKREMAIADALDEIRTRNARIERVGKGEVEVVERDLDKEKQLEKERVEKEIEEAARRAFSTEEGEKFRRIVDGEYDEDVTAAKVADGESKIKDVGLMPPPTPKRGVKRKKDFGAALGIKKKTALV
jgi:CRISPR/Cas system-associated endonuclease Cas3-HD